LKRHGLDKLLATLKSVGATHYLSGPSARTYIDPTEFDRAGITVEYLQYVYPPYQQPYPPYDPYASIIDVLFMLGPSARSALQGSVGAKGAHSSDRSYFA
jgi:hypothetical protein